MQSNERRKETELQLLNGDATHLQHMAPLAAEATGVAIRCYGAAICGRCAIDNDT
jgi:hypothetical protein